MKLIVALLLALPEIQSSASCYRRQRPYDAYDNTESSKFSVTCKFENDYISSSLQLNEASHDPSELKASRSEFSSNQNLKQAAASNCFSYAKSSQQSQQKTSSKSMSSLENAQNNSEAVDRESISSDEASPNRKSSFSNPQPTSNKKINSASYNKHQDKIGATSNQQSASNDQKKKNTDPNTNHQSVDSLRFDPFYFESRDIRFRLITDILLVGCLIFWVFSIVKYSIALKSILGFFIAYIFYWVAQALTLRVLTSILSIFTSPIVPIIVFQREIRIFLLSLGKTLLGCKSLIVQMIPWLGSNNCAMDVTPVVKAVQTLSNSKTGALIVFKKNEDLRYYEESGDLINAVVSARLLISIFNKYSPLHDGAVIIHSNRIVAARCILPVTEHPNNIVAPFGLRHKAAVGLTEITDALALIVSEESGQISIAKKGVMKNNLSGQEITSSLNNYLSSRAQ